MAQNNNRERFVELAEKRVVRAIKDLRLIGNLSNKSNYSYTDQDVSAIFRALNREIREIKQRFDGGGGKDEPVFMLPSRTGNNG